jgi:hypothetical protein
MRATGQPSPNDPDDLEDPSSEETEHLASRRHVQDFLIAVGVFVVFAIGYAQLNKELRIGPPWLVPLILMSLLAIRIFAYVSERRRMGRFVALAAASVGTIAVQASIIVLVVRLLDGDVAAPYLLRDAALLWVANVITFGAWYWEIDGGGPYLRRVKGYQPTDLAFPQIALGPKFSDGWSPEFIDYLFVAFNASSAFSPTDTSFLSRRSKLLMMAQAVDSVVLLAVVAARAINTLH